MSGRRSKARLRVALSGAILLVINLLVSAVFTWPRFTRVRRAESRAQQVAERKATVEKLWAQVASRKKLVDQNRRDIESLKRDHLKLRSEDLFAAQRAIEQMATEAGLRPKRSAYAISKVNETDLVRCEVSLPLDGTYANLTGFLSRIESGRRFILVEQMALTQDDQAARMNLKLSAIFKEGDSRASR